MSCESCKEKCGQQEQKDPGPVPYIVHEAAVSRMERTNKRLIIALIIAILLNVAWLIAWTSYDYASEESTVEVDARDGIANYIGGIGSIQNGD